MIVETFIDAESSQRRPIGRSFQKFHPVREIVANKTRPFSENRIIERSFITCEKRAKRYRNRRNSAYTLLRCN